MFQVKIGLIVKNRFSSIQVLHFMANIDTQNSRSALSIATISRYRLFIDRIIDPAWLMDSAGHIYLANQAWYKNISDIPTPREDNFWSHLSIEQRSSIQQSWNLQRSLHTAWEVQLPMHRSREQGQQREIWFSTVEFVYLGDSEHHLALWLGSSKMGNPTLQAETQALSRDLEFVRHVLETNQDCIKVIDLEGRLLYMNQGGQVSMEIDDFAKVHNEPWLSFWPEGTDEEIARETFHQATQGQAGCFEGFCATAKGTPRWWDVQVIPMFDNAGLVTKILSVSRDITDRKRTEQLLMERNRELDEFTYAASHDLKAPLRGIVNLTDWVREDLGDQLPEENQKQLQLINQRTKRLETLIDGLLQLSRVGRDNLSLEIVSVETLVNEIVDSLVVPPGIVIEVRPELPKITASKVLLTQIFANLIDNAIKHHDRSEGRIEISATLKGGFYHFVVSDDGPGVPDEHHEKIFGLFQTLHQSQSAESTGVGLALVRKNVAALGGKLWVENVKPRGCRFCFTWPKNELKE